MTPSTETSRSTPSRLDTREDAALPRAPKERDVVHGGAARTLTHTERWAPLAAGVALAIPTLLAHNLPMSDLPLHEGVVGVMRHFGDPAYFPPNLYRLNLGHPNQLFHVTAWLLSFAVGTTWACKLIVAFAQVAILQTGAWLADYLGRARWAALLFAPLALGFTYYWGLVANLLGFAAFFGALPILDRFAKAPAGRSLARALAALVVLFFAHESAFAIALGFSGLIAIGHPLDRRLTPLRFVPVLFGVVSGVGHFFYSLRFFPKSKLEIPAYFPSLGSKLAALPGDLFGSHDLETQALLFGLGAAALAALLAGRLRAREPLPRRDGSLLAFAQRLLLHYRFEATAAVFALAFMVVPLSWNSATLLHSRFLGPAWALVALTAAPRGEPPRVAKLLAAVLPLGILLLSWPQFVDSDHTFRALDRIFARIPENSSVALAALDRPPVRTRVYSASVGPARVLADRGGRMSFSLMTSPLSPVLIRPEYQWGELDRRLLISTSRALEPSFDLDRFEWVIGHSRDPAIRSVLPIAFKPDAVLIAEEGEWMLLRSTHPQASMTSPDAVPPPGNHTILERVMLLLDLQKGIAQGRLPPDALDPPPWMRAERPDVPTATTP
jgi:hypothetical protein